MISGYDRGFFTFSIRFFFLQILRFIMRDWLALPLASTSGRKQTIVNSNNKEIPSEDDESLKKVVTKEDVDNKEELMTTDEMKNNEASDMISARSHSLSNDSTSVTTTADHVSTEMTTIYWNHGGKKVQITGEFDNWTGSMEMVQDDKDPNRFVIHIPLELDKEIEYKFIVDGEWRYAYELPHRRDWRKYMSK
ncbi:uncharacterized protein BX663DRAFT_549924 [Cokeromyces recurvatus]|uniref:uncharacterized protein n=1 Tax=Cokeromyces recurvatus TaxID=90255 RepID=UPI00221F3B65|nr:uncharacterized protein BX663DRAFT_549924 [Cokeromyces recurvatus]KAI7905074.1 hypothetical protein BX663DRAFT_549924 [Cokeromyces recurvatus]